MELNLWDKTALVTGASAGIGRGIALALAEEGVQLAISARREELLRELVAEIVARGGKPPMVLAMDIMASDGPATLARRAAETLGRVDILVSNAGGSQVFDLHVNDQRWQEAFTLNFHRPRQLADALIDGMIARRWGRIINITGKSEPEHANGAMCAKAGMHGWAKGLSRMVGKFGVTVNCVAPGRIMSEQIRRKYTPEFRKWQSETEIPVGRYGEPQDIASVVTFLASPVSAYVTGAVIPVDGGLRRYQF